MGLDLNEKEDVCLKDRAVLRRLEELFADFPEARIHRKALRKLKSDFIFVRAEGRGSHTALIALHPDLRRRFGLVDPLVVSYLPFLDLQRRSVETVLSCDVPLEREREPVFIFCRDPDAKRKLGLWSRDRGLAAATFSSGENDGDTAEQFVSALGSAMASRDYYKMTTAVTGGSFYGREDLLATLVEDLTFGHVAGVIGLRKMGKTSVVKELGRLSELKQKQAFVFYDLETLPGNLTQGVSVLCRDLAHRFQRQMKNLGLRTREVSEIVNRAERGMLPDPSGLQFALQAVLSDPRSQEVRFLLALDEVESLVRADTTDSETVPEVAELLGVLRSLVQEHQNFNVVMSGLTTAPLEREVLYGRENPLFGWAKTEILGTLSNDAADRMLTEVGGRMGLSWTEEALDEMFRITSGHAYLHRDLASSVWERVREGSKDFEIREVDERRVVSTVRSWRRSASSLVVGMLGPLERNYPEAHLVLELFVEGAASLEELESEYPAGVDQLVRLSVLEEPDGTLQLSNWVRIASKFARIE